MNGLHTFCVLWAWILCHPVHETVSEVQWNEQSKRVEVALRLDILDEQWLKKQFGDTADNAADEDWQGKLLATQVLFDPREGKRAESTVSGLAIRWIGRKEEGGHVWWFFEAFSQNGKPPKSIQMRLLFDRDPSYQHRIIVLESTAKGGRARRSVVLNQQKPKSKLQLVP